MVVPADGAAGGVPHAVLHDDGVEAGESGRGAGGRAPGVGDVGLGAVPEVMDDAGRAETDAGAQEGANVVGGERTAGCGGSEWVCLLSVVGFFKRSCVGGRLDEARCF